MNDLKNLKVDRLHQLINVNLALNENYDNFEVVLQRLLHAIEVLTDCEATSFLVYDPETKDLIFRLASGGNTHELIGLVVPSGKGIAHSVAREKKGMLVNDIGTGFGEHFSGIDERINFKTRNLMAFPMLDANGDLIGVIEACNKKDDQNFTNEDFQILLIFCQQAERTIRHALKIYLLKDQLKVVAEELNAFKFPDFVYASKEMEIKYNFIKKISNSNSQMLIHGEPGTGKTHLTMQIHRHSVRSNGPLRYINCANINLKEEKDQDIYIFGAEKNYKLGIKKNVTGVIEEAEKGTVVFQEIGNLSIYLQEKLFNFLQYNTFFPYASTKEKIIDARVIATTLPRIEKLVEQGKFKEELFYKLNSLNLFLSPLRLRPDDITPLTEYYFKKSISEHKKLISKIEPKVFYILKRYGWPRNISELINVIDRAVLSCDTDTITTQHLSLHTFSIQNNFISDDDDSEAKVMTLQNSVQEFKKQYINRLLLKNNWNHTKTAKALDIQRSYLSKLVKMYDLKNQALKKESSSSKEPMKYNMSVNSFHYDAREDIREEVLDKS